MQFVKLLLAKEPEDVTLLAFYSNYSKQEVIVADLTS